MNSFWIIKFKLPPFFLSKHFFVRREKFLHRLKIIKITSKLSFSKQEWPLLLKYYYSLTRLEFMGRKNTWHEKLLWNDDRIEARGGGGRGWFEKSREQSWRRRGPRSKFSRIFGIFPFGNGTRNLGKQIPSAEFVPIDRRRVCFSCRQPVEIPKGDELSCCDKNAGLRGWGW